MAERAGVTRTLVYKHFENRDDLIVALYRREATLLDQQLVALVRNTPGGFEPKYRAMVRGLVEATDRWGTIFNPLRHTVAGTIGRREARSRDRRTLAYFAGLAADDFDLTDTAATRAVAVLLGGLDPLMWMVRPRTSATEREQLVDMYMSMATHALRSLAD